MNIEKLTTSLQFIGAALALPAGAAGVYSAYHTYFSPEVMCQEMRNATLITLEKNIPAEAKRTLLRKEAIEFEAKCGEVEPESNTIFQVALQELDRPAPARAAARAPRPVSPERSPAAVANLGPGAAAPAGAPVAVQGTSRAVHGWVTVELRKGAKVTEAYFSGYAATGDSLPAAGTVRTAMAVRPIWSQPQGLGPNDPTQLQGRLRVGECVRVVGTRGTPARQWAEVEPTACQ
jgi:hypothetical protein